MKAVACLFAATVLLAGCNDTVKVDVHAKPAPAKPKAVQGFICRCGATCAAKYGGICGSGCGCPIGH